MKQHLPCPCCGFRTLNQFDAYELCPVCFWEDDPHQSQEPGSADGANGVSLIDGQQTYRNLGAMDPAFLSKVRTPASDEGRDPNWRPHDAG